MELEMSYHIEQEELNPQGYNSDNHFTKTERTLINALRECMKSPAFRLGFARIIAGHPGLLQVEPMFTCQVAQRLIPMTEKQLSYWMRKLNIPKRYRVFGREHQRHRMLYASEVRLLRESVMRGDVNVAERVLFNITYARRGRHADETPAA
jgi:hypothetical protein